MMRTIIILCSFIMSMSSLQAQVLACLDEVTVILNDTDSTTIFAIDMLEGQSLNNDNYIIRLDDEETDESTLDLTSEDIGTRTYVVIERASQNLCFGTLVVTDKNSFAPVAICSNTIPLNLDESNRVSLSDINVGSFDDNTAVEDLIITISRDGNMQFNPGDDQFVLINSLTFSTDDLCTLVPVFMIVWDADGLRNTCLTEIAVSDNLSFCAFPNNAFNCPPGRVFYVDDNQDVKLTAQDFIFNPSLSSSYTLSIDDSEFIDSHSLDISELGVHTYSIKSDTKIVVCSGSFSLEEICSSAICPNQLSFEDRAVSEGEQICVSAFGTVESSLASIQLGITWDPNVIQYRRILETGTLGGITVNEADVSQGELKFLWLTEFGNDPLEGDFGFDICFEVIGSAGEGTAVSFSDLPNFKVEAASGAGVTFPMILESGQICIINSEINNCDFFNRAEVKSDEIPLYTNPVTNAESLILFDVNGKDASIYDNGTYGLPQSAIVAGTNEISISALPTSSPINGISTLDVVMALRYVLGIEELTPSQMIAADVDKSGDVSLTNDLIHMTNLILGIESKIEGGNWFFIPDGFSFDESFSGFDFTNDYSSYTFQDSDLTKENGLTVDIYKYGDLNNNFSFNRSTEKGLIEIDDGFISAESTSAIKIKLSSDELQSFVGAQAAFKIIDASVENVEHEFGSLLSFHVHEDQLRFTWASDETIESLDFTIHLDVDKDGMVSDFISLDQSFTREYITNDLKVFDIDLVINQTTTSTADVEGNTILLYPNPATESVTIEVLGKHIGEELLIYNALGQLEYKTTLTNKVTRLTRQNIPSDGIKIVHLDGVPSQKLLIHK